MVSSLMHAVNIFRFAFLINCTCIVFHTHDAPTKLQTLQDMLWSVGSASVTRYIFAGFQTRGGC